MNLPELPIATGTILLGAIVAAAVSVYLPFVVVAYGRTQAGYLEDMSAPRGLFEQLPDFAKRATWAHENAFESFTLFTAAALMAYVTHQTSPTAAWAAIGYVIARLLYPVFYIVKLPVGRSLAFGVGTLSIGTLFTLSLMNPG